MQGGDDTLVKLHLKHCNVWTLCHKKMKAAEWHETCATYLCNSTYKEDKAWLDKEFMGYKICYFAIKL